MSSLTPLQHTLRNLIIHETALSEDPLQVILDLFESRILFRGKPRFNVRITNGDGWTELVVSEAKDICIRVYLFHRPDCAPPRIRGVGVLLTEFEEWFLIRKKIPRSHPVNSILTPPLKMNVGKAISDLAAYRDSVWTEQEIKERKVCSVLPKLFSNSREEWYPCKPGKLYLDQWKLGGRLKTRGLNLEEASWFRVPPFNILSLRIDGEVFDFMFLLEGISMTEAIRRTLVAKAGKTYMYVISNREPDVEDLYWLKPEEWEQIGVRMTHRPPSDLSPSSLFFPFEAPTFRNSLSEAPEDVDKRDEEAHQAFCARGKVQPPPGNFRFDDDVSL